MMEYFWKQYSQLPKGVGYERFSLPHICILGVLTVLIICCVVAFRRQPEHRQERILQGIPFLMIGLEVFKDCFLIHGGTFSVGYLPLHLCSLGMFVFLFAALSKTRKWKRVFAEISVTLILPGSIAALLFPDWTTLYPVWNFMNLYGFVWHGLLVLVPILMIVHGQTDLTIRHIHYDFIFMACAGLPVYVFDQLFHCNYMFLRHGPAGTPLAVIAELTGEDFYLAGYAVFAAAVILLIYLVIELAKAGHRTREKVEL